MMQNVVRTTACKVMAAGAVAASQSSVSNKAAKIGKERNDDSDEFRTVFHCEDPHFFDDAQMIDFTPRGKECDESALTSANELGKHFESTVRTINPSPAEVSAALQAIGENPEMMKDFFPAGLLLDEKKQAMLHSAIQGVLRSDIINSTRRYIENAKLKADSEDALETSAPAVASHATNNPQESSIEDDFVPISNGKLRAENCDMSSISSSGAGTREDTATGGAEGSSESLQYGVYPYESALYSSEVQVEEPSLQWERVREKYPCVICQDLLAAPTILNCSHSFCGLCLNSMLESCVCAGGGAGSGADGELDAVGDASVEVEYQCPSCKEAITHFTFERLLDADIQRLVDAIPDCEAKRHWKERRTEYLVSAKKPKVAGQRDKGGVERIGYGHLFNNSRTSSNGGRPGAGAGAADYGDDEESWDSFVEWAVPVFSLAILALIVVVRSLK